MSWVRGDMVTGLICINVLVLLIFVVLHLAI